MKGTRGNDGIPGIPGERGGRVSVSVACEQPFTCRIECFRPDLLISKHCFLLSFDLVYEDFNYVQEIFDKSLQYFIH